MCCGRGVDPCTLVALNDIATKQAAPASDTITKTDVLMDDPRACPNAVIRFHASDTLLKTATDAACLVLPKARSRAALHWRVGWEDNDDVNGPVYVFCSTIKNVVSSAAEAKTAGTHMGATNACPMITALEEMGHPQPKTGSPIETDNSTAHGVLNSKMRQKLSKSFDVRCWWVKDRINQGQFNLIWAPGKLNRADYFTKHHPPWHHRKQCYNYLQKVYTVLKTI